MDKVLDYTRFSLDKCFSTVCAWTFLTPYIISFPIAPENYEELLELLNDQSDSDHLIIIDRIRKCQHPSLGEGNKQKLEVR